MRNVNLKRVLFVPRIYSSLSEGCRNEDRRYALLLLAMEVVSFILDLLGGSHWGYLLASFLLSVLILETTIYAYFIKRSRIKSEAQQLIAVEIVFSVLQLIISCYCLIRTLSGVKINYSSSVFPLAYSTISAVVTFKSKKDVSRSSSYTPSNQFGIVEDTYELELNNVRVDPSVTPVDEVDPLDQSFVSVPTSDAKVDPLDPSLVSVPSGDVEVDPLDPLDPSLLSVPSGDAEVEPLDPTLVSVPTSDARVDPWDPTLVSVCPSDANVPHTNTLRQRYKQSQLQKLMFKMEPCNDKASKIKVIMRTL